MKVNTGDRIGKELEGDDSCDFFLIPQYKSLSCSAYLKKLRVAQLVKNSRAFYRIKQKCKILYIHIIITTYSSKILNTSGSISSTTMHCFSASGPKHMASNTGLQDARINLWALNIYKIDMILLHKV